MKDTKIKHDAHCVQCGAELCYTINSETIDKAIFVCHNPECGNYGLLCVAAEKMPKEK